MAAPSATTRRTLRLRAGSIRSGIIAAVLLALTRMALARPRRENQNQTGIADGPDLAPLVRLKVRQEPGGAGLGLAAMIHLDLPVGDEEIRALVNLVVLE